MGVVAHILHRKDSTTENQRTHNTPEVGFAFLFLATEAASEAAKREKLFRCAVFWMQIERLKRNQPW